MTGPSRNWCGENCGDYEALLEDRRRLTAEVERLQGRVDCKGMEPTDDQEDWVLATKRLVDRVIEADRTLGEALDIDSLPAQAVLASSTARAELWNFIIDMPNRYKQEWT